MSKRIIPVIFGSGAEPLYLKSIGTGGYHGDSPNVVIPDLNSRNCSQIEYISSKTMISTSKRIIRDTSEGKNSCMKTFENA
jgi:hypothetical protein